MKKFLICFIVIITCQFSFAQDAMKLTFEEKAKTDLKLLKSVVDVQSVQEQSLLDFFYRKYKQYTVYTLTSDNRKQILVDYERELKGFLNTPEISKLDKNQSIMMKLISDN